MRILVTSRTLHSSKSGRGKASYHAYTNITASPEWLNRELTYRILGKKNRYAGYRAYVAQGNSEEILQFYSNGNIAAV